MALFRRKRAAGADAPTANGQNGESGRADQQGRGGQDARAAGAQQAEAGEPDPQSGPFDVDDLPTREGLVDLGGIMLPGIQGLVVSMEMDQASGDVTAVRIHLGESQLQLQAFAAPRSSGIWDEIRTEIGTALEAQGGSSQEQEGEFGTELIVRVPGRGPDGKQVTTAMRFVGIDRPRWFLRGVLTGPAATDPQAASPFFDLIHVTVVNRGTEPMAPRELLPLHLPPEAPGSHPTPGGQPADQSLSRVGEQGAGQADTSQNSSQTDASRSRARSTDDLKPFERGPEITEIR